MHAHLPGSPSVITPDGLRAQCERVVMDYRWLDNGNVEVTASWGYGKRRTFQVPANEFNDTSLRLLRERTARDILEGRTQ